MSAWLESGRSAVEEALAAAFDRLDENIRTELQARDYKDSELFAELQQLKTQAAEVDRLQQENHSLKDEIERLRQTQRVRAPESSPKRRKVLGELSPNKASDPQHANPQGQGVDATSIVQKKYNKLRVRYKALELSRDEYKSKLRQRVEEIDRWAEGVDSRDRLIASLRKKLAQSRHAPDVIPDPRPEGTGHGGSMDDETLDPTTSVPKRPSPDSSFEQLIGAVSDTTGVSTSPTRAVLEHNPRQVVQSHLSEAITKDSTGEDCPLDDNIELPRLPEHSNNESRILVKVELSSDGPVFVSERSVRKRKHDREDEPNYQRLQRIKSEHSSSGPEYVGEVHNFVPAESLDFEEDAHVPTPRKRRDRSHNRQQDQEADAESTTGPLSSEISKSDATAPSAAAGKPPTPAQDLGLILPAFQASALHIALGRQSRPITPHNQQPYKSRSPLLDIGVRSLAEDETADLDNIQRPVARGRLDALLNSPSVRTPKPIIRPEPLGLHTPRDAFFGDHEDFPKVPAPRELPHGKRSLTKDATITPVAQLSTVNIPSPKTTVARGRPPKKPSILRDDMPRGRLTDREKTPIRRKPMDKLRPEDFKPNPRYNDGLSYVYDEVNRGKSAAERAAQTGCTDPSCCGKTFRAFAEAERSNIGPSVATRAEDIKLLEDYLGDEAYKLGTMTREEKEETWLQAKTWELANKFGKHRQRYARMPSPPGFWNVEFPNTQERAEERRQAEEIRKALVHERYREAMRPGGKWLFRDEEAR